MSDYESNYKNGRYSADRSHNNGNSSSHQRGNSPRKKKKHNGIRIVLIIEALIFAALAVLIIYLLGGKKKNTEAPVISGAQDITITAGDTVLYRQGVSAVDTQDGEVELQLDASAVDTSTPGTYQVIYWAVDSDGNQSQEVKVTVTVEAPPTEPTTVPTTEALPELDESSELYAQASKVYSSIIKDTDTVVQKAKAIWKWCRYNISFVGHADKGEWQDGALLGFKQRKGDCFTYFSCAKTLLIMADIENIDVVKIKMEGRSNHYWNMINVDGQWYHFDSCPRNGAGSNTFFMYTDEQMLNFSEQNKDCFDFDLTLYPRTPGTISDKYLIKFYPQWFDENGNRLTDANGNLAGTENYNP